MSEGGREIGERGGRMGQGKWGSGRVEERERGREKMISKQWCVKRNQAERLYTQSMRNND